MAVLKTQQRQEVHHDLMRQQLGDVAITKIQLRNAIDAADAWVDANAASFNSALPTAARTGLTALQKAMLLVWIVEKRFKVGT